MIVWHSLVGPRRGSQPTPTGHDPRQDHAMHRSAFDFRDRSEHLFTYGHDLESWISARKLIFFTQSMKHILQLGLSRLLCCLFYVCQIVPWTLTRGAAYIPGSLQAVTPELLGARIARRLQSTLVQAAPRSTGTVAVERHSRACALIDGHGRFFFVSEAFPSRLKEVGQAMVAKRCEKSEESCSAFWQLVLLHECAKRKWAPAAFWCSCGGVGGMSSTTTTTPIRA